MTEQGSRVAEGQKLKPRETEWKDFRLPPDLHLSLLESVTVTQADLSRKHERSCSSGEGARSSQNLFWILVAAFHVNFEYLQRFLMTAALLCIARSEKTEHFLYYFIDYFGVSDTATYQIKYQCKSTFLFYFILS